MNKSLAHRAIITAAFKDAKEQAVQAIAEALLADPVARR
jgi:hypothetical protein